MKGIVSSNNESSKQREIVNEVKRLQNENKTLKQRVNALEMRLTVMEQTQSANIETLYHRIVALESQGQRVHDELTNDDGNLYDDSKQNERRTNVPRPLFSEQDDGDLEDSDLNDVGFNDEDIINGEDNIDDEGLFD